MRTLSQCLSIGVALFAISACQPSTEVTSGEIENPTPQGRDYFGINSIILKNGDIAAIDRNNISNEINKGEMYIFDSSNKELKTTLPIGMIGNITQLKNGDLVTNNPNWSTTESESVGGVFFINGDNYEVIKTITGDNPNDKFGDNVIELSNGNVVIQSRYDNVNENAYSGSITIINGNTYEVIKKITGDNAYDLFGGETSDSIVELSNGNLVIISERDIVNGNYIAGSVTIVNGENYEVIKTYTGDDTNDFFGNGGITELNNGNILILSIRDNVGELSKAGSVTVLENGSYNLLKVFTGDDANDQFGFGGITALRNSSFIINTSKDNLPNIERAGSTKLIDGSTLEIVQSINGTSSDPNMNPETLSYMPSIVQLGNGDIIIGDYRRSVNGNKEAGTISIINEDTLQTIKTINGSSVGDSFGISITELKNGDIALSTPYHKINNDENPDAITTNTGSVTILDGTTYNTVKTFYGSKAYDYLSFKKNLGNGDFAIYQRGEEDKGYIHFIDGNNYEVIKTLTGSAPNKKFGESGLKELSNGNLLTSTVLINGDSYEIINEPNASGIKTPLRSGNYVITSRLRTVNGVENAGYIKVINGETGEIIETINGEAAYDTNLVQINESSDNSFITIARPNSDNNGLNDSGSLHIVALP